MKDEANKKHTPKRSKPQIEQDKADISRCYLNGMGQREIVGWIAQNRRYTLSLGMVNRIVQEVIGEWREITSHNIETAKALDLARIERVYAEACRGFDRSCKDLVVERRVNGKLGTITQKRDGDPRFLAIMVGCIKQQSEILGYATTPEPEQGGQAETPRVLGPDIEVALEIAYGKKSESSPDAPHWTVAMRV